MGRLSIKLVMSASSVGLVLLANAAWSQQDPAAYPIKPVRIIVESSPGGGVDLMARAVAQGLTEKWGKPVVVENRTGGGGVIALTLIAGATPDGYTLYGGGSQVVTATPLKKVPFDIRTAFIPIAQLASTAGDAAILRRTVLSTFISAQLCSTELYLVQW